jgi:hypothetical protein
MNSTLRLEQNNLKLDLYSLPKSFLIEKIFFKFKNMKLMRKEINNKKCKTIVLSTLT